jgi:SAM-dependent methyltransferase
MTPGYARARRPAPGATLRRVIDAATVLRAASDGHGTGPLPWVAAPLRDADRVLDVSCGAGALAPELGTDRWLGIDPAPARYRPRLRAEPAALPVRTNGVDGVAMVLTLPRLTALDSVFAELRRVLRPAGTLVVLVPSASIRTVAELRHARVLTAVHRSGWTNRSALDRAGWLLQAADFAVLADDRVAFTLPLPDAAAAVDLVEALPRCGLWPSTLPREVLTTVAHQLATRAGPGQVLPVPMRRLVARR